MQNVLIEVYTDLPTPFESHAFALEALDGAKLEANRTLTALGIDGIEVDPAVAPVPMLLRSNESKITTTAVFDYLDTLRGGPHRSSFGSDIPGRSLVIAARVTEADLTRLERHDEIVVWPNSELVLFDAVPIDCRPFKPGVDISVIRSSLDVDAAWADGFRGDGIVVGIIDEGVNGANYPIHGGFARPQSKVQPGGAAVTSHGSMCAADILVAAPNARLYDYPFLGVPNSGGALQMFQAILDQRRRDGTPHITNSSYGFVMVPDRETNPRHEVHDIEHPVHRKVREVVATGVACFFAAGNCGQDCPSGNCDPSSVGPGRSVHASNSLAEVITVAAVNNQRERIGYSSQGPGMFEAQKPDLACYSHFFGNFGPNRPGGMAQPFDNGTSAATPVAAGVAALLLSAFPHLDPVSLKEALVRTAVGGSAWTASLGYGVIDAGAAYRFLRAQGIA